MELYTESNNYKSNNYKLYQGNMLDMLEVIEPCSIDSIVTDPPYELNFMGKGWDNAGVSFQKETWEKCYEVLKPGGYLLAFGGSRTFHRIACAIEDAGFEIRDTIMWLYGSGFPKSMNIGKKIEKWKGWGTALKPSFEPIIVARKPFKGSLVDNVIQYGVGGINIDECRVGTEERTYKGCGKSNVGFIGGSFENGSKEDIKYTAQGRFPANTILTYGEDDYDEVCGGFPYTKGEIGRAGRKDGGNYNASSYKVGVVTDYGFKDEGSASRYFYCAKASKKDRDEGLDVFEEKINCDRNVECYSADVPFNRSANPKKNTHPTVKPTELMQYLVRLVTPNNGIILDPFNGSGSTGKAVMYENKERDKNYKYIGIELEPEYLNISKARLDFIIKR